ncbi:hypothetical protein Tco_0070873 [Tanacetum coccineum]
MEILLESTSNKLMVDSILQAGNPVKEILHKLNLPDHRILKDGGEGVQRSHSRQDKEQAQDLKSMITASNHKLKIEVKDYEHKTKVEA